MRNLPEHRAEQALAQTRGALKLEANRPLAPEEASIFLKYLVLESLKDRAELWRQRLSSNPEQGAELKRQLASCIAEWALALPSAHLPALPNAADIGRSLTSSPTYRERIADLVTEAVLSESMAPETCIAPHAADALHKALPGRHHHLVVFATSPLFTHEFYPLVVDAFTRDADRHGGPHFNLLAAHCDWLTIDGRLRRVLYMDWENERFHEVSLTRPLVPDSAQFLCLGAAEIDLHRLWSERLPWPQVNPSAAAALADDKAAVLTRWQSLGLEVPAHLACSAIDCHKILQWRQNFAAIAVKPNGATEGRDVAFFAADTPKEVLCDHLDVCCSQGLVLAQERRDGALFRDPERGTLHTLALRFNAAFDGRSHRIESAYAQIGPDAKTPAARGRGGTILDLSAVLPHLVQRQGRELAIDEGDLATLRARGEAAAGIFADLLLVGLDVVLDVDERGCLQPVFLEANPRPAGLSRSRFLGSLLPGVSAGLWDGLQHRCASGDMSHAA